MRNRGTESNGNASGNCSRHETVTLCLTNADSEKNLLAYTRVSLLYLDTFHLPILIGEANERHSSLHTSLFCQRWINRANDVHGMRGGRGQWSPMPSLAFCCASAAPATMFPHTIAAMNCFFTTDLDTIPAHSVPIRS